VNRKADPSHICTRPDSTDSPQPVYEPPDAERPASSAAPSEAILTAAGSTVSTTGAASIDPYAAFRYRDFSLYMLGWIVGVSGDQILEVAIGWDIYQRTHNALSLGWVGLVTAIPVIGLALPAGHLADQFDRRRIVLISQVFRSISILMLAWVSAHQGSIGVMYALLFIGAIARAIAWPARSALMPSLVPPEVFPNAINWNSSGFQIASMAGPALGGFLLLWNVPAAYIISAVCGAVFAGVLIPVKSPTQVKLSSKKESGDWKTLAAGVHFVWSSKIILATITLDLFAVLLGGATYLLPIFAASQLHVGSIAYGWLRAAPAIGALAMGIAVAHLPPFKHAGRAMLYAVAGFGVATIIFGFSRDLWLSLVMLFLTGAFDNVSVLVRHTLVQVLTPDTMRGRVSAVNNIFIGASNELGGFESGATARLWGPITSVVGGGIGTILVVIAVGLIWPQVWRFGSLTGAAQTEEKAAS
jgi:MFS family permease